MTDQPDGSPASRRVRQHKDAPLPVEPLSLRPEQAWKYLGISRAWGFELLKAGVLHRIPRQSYAKRATAITMESLKAFAEGRDPPPKPEGAAEPLPAPQPKKQPTSGLVKRPRARR